MHLIQHTTPFLTIERRGFSFTTLSISGGRRHFPVSDPEANQGKVLPGGVIRILSQIWKVGIAPSLTGTI